MVNLFFFSSTKEIPTHIAHIDKTPQEPTLKPKLCQRVQFCLLSVMDF